MRSVQRFSTQVLTPHKTCVESHLSLVFGRWSKATIPTNDEGPTTNDQRLSPACRKIPHILCITASGVLPTAEYHTSCI